MLKNRCTFATLPRTQRGVPLVLGADPKGKNFLYTNGHSVIIRDIDEPNVADIYTEHSAQTTVAKYSPSGFYIASADVTGKVRIWDTINQEHILKAEYQPFVGVVKDLSWSNDSQRLVIVGEGRERFGAVIMMETGTTVGEIAGHSKAINSCDFKPTRPFRIVTGSEDNFICVYEGPPFKFKHQLEDHQRFVQTVRFNNSGELFASGGFDGKLFLYKGKDYEKVGEIGSPAHGGGVYAVSWSPDGTKLLSASGDKTAKIWDVNTLTCITEFPMGPDLMDQQVSCLWQGQHKLSVSLSGFVNYLDENCPQKPLKIIKGHNKSITAMALHVTPEKELIFTGSHDGFVTQWDSKTGLMDRIAGNNHTNQVQDMSPTSDFVYTCGLDDTVRDIYVAGGNFDHCIKLDSQPHGLTALKDNTTVIVANIDGITFVVKGMKQVYIPVAYEPTCISINPDETEVAVGGAKDSKVHIYAVNGYNLSQKNELKHTGQITVVSYSPDGKFFAAADTNRKIMLYLSSTYELAHQVDWGFHMARVNCLAWAPDSIHLASGSLDTAIIIWDVLHPTRHVTLKKAHPQSQITKIGWLNENTLVTTGHDSNVKLWDVQFA